MISVFTVLYLERIMDVIIKSILKVLSGFSHLLWTLNCSARYSSQTISMISWFRHEPAHNKSILLVIHAHAPYFVSK